MKVLLINNFYYNRGGDCTYMFSLKKLLEKNGHKVIFFSMHHPLNFDSKYSKHFVSHIDYAEEIKNKSISSAFKVLSRTLFSEEAKRKIEILIKEEKPDIAHLQNIHHHITPSIFHSLKKHNIPIIWTLHDYTLICPNTSFLDHGRICERCKKWKYFWPLLVRCKKGSFSASAMAAFEITLHKLMRIYNKVDVYIAPSKFLKNKFVEYGFNEANVKHLDHFIDFPVIKDKITSENYYLYVGRISEEKGIKTLIDAAIKVNSCHLKIVGGGPLLNEMIAYVKEKDKNNIIEFSGHKSREDLFDIFKNCKFVVVPSEWYENAGLIIFEAFSCGKPVIGANIGGIPEFVKDNVRGITYKPGDVDELCTHITHFLNNPDIVLEMGENARTHIDQNLNDEKHYDILMKIYKDAISKH